MTQECKGGKTVDPNIEEVSITENGTVSVRPQGFDGLSGVDVTVDVPSPELEAKVVSITENGTTTIEPETAYGLSNVQVTVEVPAPSGGNVLILKKNNVSVPQGSRVYVYDTESYIENLNGNPFTVISSDTASKVYMFRTYAMSEMGMTLGDTKELKNYNLPITTRNIYESEIGVDRTYSPDSYIIVFGTDTPGATLTVDTTYFDIVELPDGFSGDFNIGTNIDE